MDYLASDSFFDALGWVAAAFLLTGYLLVSLRKIAPDGHFYQWANIGGSGLLFINTWHYRAYPSAFVNIVWMGIGLAVMWRARRHLHPSP